MIGAQSAGTEHTGTSSSQQRELRYNASKILAVMGNPRETVNKACLNAKVVKDRKDPAVPGLSGMKKTEQ